MRLSVSSQIGLCRNGRMRNLRVIVIDALGLATRHRNFHLSPDIDHDALLKVPSHWTPTVQVETP
jgi:hypothetical protein